MGYRFTVKHRLSAKHEGCDSVQQGAVQSKKQIKSNINKLEFKQAVFACTLRRVCKNRAKCTVFI